MLNKMENGSGIKMTLVIDGNAMNFNLAVMGRKSWRGELDYEYGFVNDDCTKYFRAPYTGGNTGFGCNNYDIKIIDADFLESYQIITTDIDAIRALAEADEKAAKQTKEDFDNAQTEKTAKINALPKTFEIGIPIIDATFEFARSDAEYSAAYSSKVKGGGITLRKKGADDDYRCYIYMDNYTTKDGKFLVKRFAGDMKHIFGDAALQFDPKDLLTVLVNRQKELTAMIRNIK